MKKLLCTLTLAAMPALSEPVYIYDGIGVHVIGESVGEGSEQYQGWFAPTGAVMDVPLGYAALDLVKIPRVPPVSPRVAEPGYWALAVMCVLALTRWRR